MLPPSSKSVSRDDFTTLPGGQCLENAQADLFLDEPHAAVGEQEVGSARVPRPVLIPVRQAGRRVGTMTFSGVRENQRPAALGVEAGLGLKVDQRHVRIRDGTGPRG